MAGSRSEAFGTIYSRMKGLLTSNAVKHHDRPVWFDVYEAFPPKVEPKRLRPVPDLPLRTILYPEDNIRAKFYDKFGAPGIIDLSSTDRQYKSVCQKFVDHYTALAKESSDLNEDEIFNKTKEKLISEGVLFKKSRSHEQNTEAKEEFVQKVYTKRQKGFSVDSIMTDE
ncbi:28S ribosomal protein S23, mitochondrial [Halotydeus destructor]|nr:28S ribosomal protein S23, mitochondrial [Halotydeus destructor]